MKGKVGSVLFDAVGTLIRPYPSVGSVYARAAAPFGVRCSPRSLDGHFRQAYHELMPERFSGGRACRTSEARERRWWKKAVSRTFERAGCGRVPPAVTEAAFEAFAAGGAWRPYADAVPTLERLTALGCRLGLISNLDSRLRGVMKDLGLADFFDHLTISSESCRAKPSEKIFQQAVRALGTGPG
jgi:putative hydrolase of the HAD superfamily